MADLKEGELDPGLALVLCDGKELHHAVVANVGGQRVTVLIHHPLAGGSKVGTLGDKMFCY